jgi:hypothetical protein
MKVSIKERTTRGKGYKKEGRKEGRKGYIKEGRKAQSYA